MIICHVWDADYPWDVRVEKVCASLQKKHEVHLVCRNSQRRPSHEIMEELSIHRLPALPRAFGRFNALIGFPAFFNPLWLFKIWIVVRKIRADLILVRDIPLALSALIVGRLLKVPVVLDMAENYPAMMEDLKAMTSSGLQTTINSIVRNPNIVRAVERVAIHSVSHILVVVEEARERLVGMGVPHSEVSLVMNTPTLDRLQPPVRDALQGSLSTKQEGSIRLIYLGLLELPRGLDTVIAGLDLLRDRLPGLHLRIIGSGRDTDRLRAMVSARALTDRVEFLGWIDYKEAIRYIQEADIGLVPHHATESWNTTIPNKLFDYMSMGKPVIVSSARPTKRIVEEEQCGAVFKSRDQDDFAKAVLRLTDTDVRRECGRHGRDAVMRRYNWQLDEERLLAAIANVAV